MKKNENVFNQNSILKPLRELTNHFFFTPSLLQEHQLYSIEKAFAILLRLSLIHGFIHPPSLENPFIIVEDSAPLLSQPLPPLEEIFTALLNRYWDHAETMDNRTLILNRQNYFFNTFESSLLNLSCDAELLHLLLTFYPHLPVCSIGRFASTFCFFHDICVSIDEKSKPEHFFDVQKIGKSLLHYCDFVLEAMSSPHLKIYLNSRLLNDESYTEISLNNENQSQLEYILIKVLQSYSRISKKIFAQLAEWMGANEGLLHKLLEQYSSEDDISKLQFKVGTPSNITSFTKPYDIAVSKESIKESEELIINNQKTEAKNEEGFNMGYMPSLRAFLSKIKLEQTESRSWINKPKFFLSPPRLQLETMALSLEKISLLLKNLSRFESGRSMITGLRETVFTLLLRLYVIGEGGEAIKAHLATVAEDLDMKNCFITKDIRLLLGVSEETHLETKITKKSNALRNKMTELRKNTENLLKVESEKKQEGECVICHCDTEIPLILMCTKKEVLLEGVRAVLLSTCGHPSHLSCMPKSRYNNTIKCCLCEQQFLFTLPLKLEGNENPIISLEEIYESKKMKSNTFDEFLTSIAFHVATVGLIKPEYFFRSAAPIYRILLSKMPNQIEEIIEDTDTNSLFKYVYTSIKSYLKRSTNESTKNKNWEKFAVKGIKIIDKMKIGEIEEEEMNNEDMEELKKGWNRPKLHRNLEDQFQECSGKCPYCNQVSNRIAVCLGCSNFRVCEWCTEMPLAAHVDKVHPSGAIFLRVHLGDLYYASRNRAISYAPLYLNFKQEEFREIFPLPNRTEFLLDPRPLQAANLAIATFSVEIELRLRIRLRGKFDDISQENIE